MDYESEDLVVFQGTRPKPPPNPDLARYFKCSADYGNWWGSKIPKQRKKKEGRRKRGKIRLFPDE